MPADKREGSDVTSAKIRHRKLRAFYRENFPGLRTHHLIPRSRGGPTSYFVLFPWNEKSHNAWHQLFFNMTVQEVWERLDEIYAAIYSDAEKVIPFWIESCTLLKASPKKMAVFEDQKRNKLSWPISNVKLQELWSKCFKSEKLSDAKTLMLYMVMFLVFGSKMADPDSINQDDVELLLSTMPETKEYRRWAVGVCLNQGVNDIMSKIDELHGGSQ